VDPNNEYDEDYFEFDLFMSRREYKAITRRQQRGRMASIREGKWISNKAPYGYDRVKLSGEKGWTLLPNADAPTVQSVFTWYAPGRTRRLADCAPSERSRILSPTGKDWTNSVVRSMLANPTYAGLVSWGRRATAKTVKDGEITKSRPRSHDYTVVPGLHPAIVPEETWDAVQSRLATNPSRPGPKQVQTKTRSPVSFTAPNAAAP
jgi:hypothetical protein